MGEKIYPFRKAGLRKKSFYCYNSALDTFLSWTKKERLSNTDIGFFDRYHAQNYLDYLAVTGGISNTSINNKITYLKALFNGLEERNVISGSPFAKVKKLKQIKSFQNLAYTETEIIELKNVIEAEAPKLWVFVQLIYYCYIRPAEIRGLKKENFNLVARKIFIPAEISKNGKDDYVDVPTKFLPDLKKFIDQCKPRTYIFPGTKEGQPIAINLMTSWHKTFLKRLKFDDRNTLYS